LASRVGYDDPNYFGRVFKNMEGIPPSKFRSEQEIPFRKDIFRRIKSKYLRILNILPSGERR